MFQPRQPLHGHVTVIAMKHSEQVAVSNALQASLLAYSAMLGKREVSKLQPCYCLILSSPADSASI